MFSYKLPDFVTPEMILSMTEQSDKDKEVMFGLKDSKITMLDIGESLVVRDYFKYDALVHTHTKRDCSPSYVDMQGQIETNMPWGIISTHNLDKPHHVLMELEDRVVFWGTDIAELEGRPFIHGVYDCFSLCRDWYRLRGHDIPDFARPHNWWEGSIEPNMYVDHMAEAGFHELKNWDDLKEGDVAVASINSPVPNHAGILLADGTLLHHLQDRLSVRQPARHYRKFLKMVLRKNEN